MSTDRHPAWIRFLGLDVPRARPLERLLSGLGGLIGIILVSLLARIWLGDAAIWIVASMGASAVLVFAVPHGPLSQPWALVGGHLVSALIGITCVLLLGTDYWVGALAVGLAITGMHYANCVHPPGGATALSCVLGGQAVWDLGYAYVLTPVLLNALVLLGVAILFNALLPWRRYPRFFAESSEPVKEGEPLDIECPLGTEDWAQALRDSEDTLLVTPEFMEDMFQEARRVAVSHYGIQPEQLEKGRYYSNGRQGHHWSVRMVLDLDESKQGPKDLIIWHGSGGADTNLTKSESREDFAQWARYEVVKGKGRWERVRHTA